MYDYDPIMRDFIVLAISTKDIINELDPDPDAPNTDFRLSRDIPIQSVVGYKIFSYSEEDVQTIEKGTPLIFGPINLNFYYCHLS